MTPAASATTEQPLPPRRILVCDDEPQTVRALRVILREGGYETIASGTLHEAIELAAAAAPEGAIVDLMLPDGSGIELCAELRSWSAMPIVVLSALDEEEQKVKALHAGADDYVTKPFSARELLARLDAVFRRIIDADEQPVITVKGLEINLPAHTVRRDGRDVELTPNEFKLLSALARNRGRLMTTRALLAEIRDPTRPAQAGGSDSPLLRTHIANLRHKIEDEHATTWQYIRTEPGVGYRFAD
jgi:two-component system, OmpR family, KDP operon response regulator KdpE